MWDYFQNRWIRFGVFLATGVLVRLAMDVLFSLMYRNYALLQPAETYLGTLLLAGLSLEGFYQVKRKLDRSLPWNNNPYRRFALQWLSGAGLGLFFGMGVRWIYLSITQQVTFIALVDEMIVVITILIVITALTAVELSVFLLDKWRFSLAELERFKKENAEFQFESLRSQVNPHFLFNSLNTLSSLIYENPEKAEKFIRELSDVYRYILEIRGQELVPLSREIQLATSYIYLVQLRFDRNLEINLEVDPDSTGLMIAPLTLQLLIENAVKHNVISGRKPLRITIICRNGQVEVRNNLQRKDSKDYSSELGLKNIRSRYAFLTDVPVTIMETRDEFIVKIPLIKRT